MLEEIVNNCFLPNPGFCSNNSYFLSCIFFPARGLLSHSLYQDHWLFSSLLLGQNRQQDLRYSPWGSEALHEAANCLTHTNGNVLGLSPPFSFPSVSQQPWYKLDYIATRVGITPLTGGLVAVPHLFIICLQVLWGSGFGDAATGKGIQFGKCY